MPEDVGRLSGADISPVLNQDPYDLVCRVPSPSDERSVLVALTAAGRAYGEQIMRVAKTIS